jgi:hypothetical protein
MKIKNLLEGLNAQQRSVPQLPAQARARHISVLGAKTDPQHPFAGYMVGADESAQPGKKSIGPDQNDPYEKGWRAQPDAANPYAAGTAEHAKWQDGRDEREAQPNHYDESVTEAGSPAQQAAIAIAMKKAGKTPGSVDEAEAVKQRLDPKCWKGKHIGTPKTKVKGGVRVNNCVPNESVAEEERNELDTPAVQAALAKMAERHRGEKWSKEQLAALGKRIAARGQAKKGVDETVSTHKGGKITKTPSGIKHQAAPGNYGGYEPEFDHLRTLDKNTTGRIERSMDIKHKREKAWQGGIELDEAVTKEDIITKLKAKLGDYLSDIGQQIKNDPTLQDKLTAKAPGDQMGPPVKTITTDDGHQIQIHGNEDDGFRISIKNKPAATKFNNLDEAVMACEMYCAHRRKQALNADYVEEA